MMLFSTPIFFALASAFFAALVAICAKMGLQGVDSTYATMLRSIIMAIMLVGFTIVTGKISRTSFETISLYDLWWIFLSGLAGSASWLCYFYALQKGTAGTVAAIDRLSMVFIIILAAIVLHESFTLNKIFGACMMVFGAVLITVS